MNNGKQVPAKPVINVFKAQAEPFEMSAVLDVVNRLLALAAFLARFTRNPVDDLVVAILQGLIASPQANGLLTELLALVNAKR